MSLYNGPARGGNRGGKDQFNWDSVKSDKDREFYLGHSVKATTGRWQKGVVTSAKQQSNIPLVPTVLWLVFWQRYTTCTLKTQNSTAQHKD